MIKRYPTKQIYVGNVPIGGDAPISVQSMTFTKTYGIILNINITLEPLADYKKQPVI